MRTKLGWTRRRKLRNFPSLMIKVSRSWQFIWAQSGNVPIVRRVQGSLHVEDISLPLIAMDLAQEHVSCIGQKLSVSDVFWKLFFPELCKPEQHFAISFLTDVHVNSLLRNINFLAYEHEQILFLQEFTPTILCSPSHLSSFHCLLLGGSLDGHSYQIVCFCFCLSHIC